jgi:hypothetical protein
MVVAARATTSGIERTTKHRTRLVFTIAWETFLRRFPNLCS